MLRVKLRAIPPITMQSRRPVRRVEGIQKNSEETPLVIVDNRKKRNPRKKTNGLLRSMALYQIDKLQMEIEEYISMGEEGFDVSNEISKLSLRLNEWESFVGNWRIDKK